MNCRIRTLALRSLALVVATVAIGCGDDSRSVAPERASSAPDDVTLTDDAERHDSWSGLCVDGLGNPLARCQVALEPVGAPDDATDPAPPLSVGETGRDGRFSIPVSAGGTPVGRRLVLTLAHRDFAPRLLEVRAGRGRSFGAITFPSRRAFEVRVLDDGGEPLAGALIEAEPLLVPADLPPDATASLRRSAVTDDDGVAFLTPARAEQPTRLSVRADGFGTRVRVLHVDDDPRAARTTVYLERTATVRGRLVSGSPEARRGIADAELELTVALDDHTVVHSSGWTDADGNFRLPDVPRSNGRDATLSFTLQHDVGRLAHGSVLRIRPAPGSDGLTGGPLEIALPERVVAIGRIARAPAGDPVGGATVRALRALVSANGRIELLPVARSDDDGRFALIGFSSPVAADGDSPAPRESDPGGRIPVEITSEPDPALEDPTVGIPALRTVIPMLPSDLRTIADDAALSGAAATTLTLDPPPAVAGRVTARSEPDGAVAPLPAATIELWSIAAADRGAIGRPALGAEAGADGRFRLLGVVPGTYRLSASAPGLATAWTPPFGVGRTGTVTAPLPTLGPGATVEIRFPASRSKAVEVELRPVAADAETDDPRRPLRSLATGRPGNSDSPPTARFEHVPPGSWNVLYHFLSAVPTAGGDAARSTPDPSALRSRTAPVHRTVTDGRLDLAHGGQHLRHYQPR